MNTYFYPLLNLSQIIVLVFFLIYSAINTIMVCLCVVNTFQCRKKARYRTYKDLLNSAFSTPVSILVPCFNEEKTISATIRSLLSLEYGQYQIIVINDGSIDNTLKHLKDEFELNEISDNFEQDKQDSENLSTQKIHCIYQSKLYPILTIIDKDNGGKADALNAGINISTCPLVISLDADSLVSKDFLQKHTFPFISEDDSLVAAGGIVKIANGNIINKGYVEQEKLPNKFIEMCQVIEYTRSFNAFRIGLASINSILIIPGTLGIFKKDLLIKIGGYNVETIGEDMDIILKIHRYMKKNKKKYLISLLCEVECWTQVPSELIHLKNQRIRWQRGLLDCLIKNKDMTLNPHFGVLGMFGIPYYWIFELLTPIIEFMGILIIVVSLILNTFILKFIFTFVTLDILVGIFISISALIIDNYRKGYNEKTILNFTKLLSYCVIENFGYRQLINWWRFVAFFGYKYKGNLWGQTIRKSF